MEPNAAITPDTFNIVHLFLSADWVVRGVMIGLAAASLWSWAVIIDKSVRFALLEGQANKFEGEVSSGRALEDVARAAGENPRHALPRMLQTALREWREARAKGLLSAGPAETQSALLVQRIDRVLGSLIARESQRVEDGLGSLAIVATASPNGRLRCQNEPRRPQRHAERGATLRDRWPCDACRSSASSH